MFIPRSYRVTDDVAIDAFIRAHDFATLISAGTDAPDVTHLPLTLERRGEERVLVGHLARANPHWRRMDGRTPFVAIFHGPHAYISPTWYAESPAVPTWNYAVVHAHGIPVARDDRDFLDAAVRALTSAYEDHRTPRWRVDDLPTGWHERMLQAIVGFEMPVARVEAAFKLGQNRSADDRRGAVAGLRASGDAGAGALADMMESTLEPAAPTEAVP